MPTDMLDEQSRAAVIAASRAAESLRHDQLATHHLLLGLLFGDNAPSRVMAGFGVTATMAKSHLAALGARPALTGERSQPEVRALITQVQRDAQAQHTMVTATHLARAVLGSPDAHVRAILEAAHTSAAEVLSALDAVDPAAADTLDDEVFDQERDTRYAGDGTRPAPAPAQVEQPTTALPADLLKFGRDLTAAARAGELMPVHGRDSELFRVETILGRRTKNNPVLVGEAGVGKTAVIEALAHRIADGRCSAALLDRPVISLDVASMIAGARNRGDFELRLKKAVKAAQSANAIVFIDEIHQIVGAGAAGGSMDAANLLKENLARGELTLVGATTLDEWRKHITKDAALERRLEPVRVEAPTVDETVDILRTLRAGFAAHHRVTYTDEAVRAAATLTDKHVRDRQLPDKAIDALDEAGAAAAIAMMRTDEHTATLYRDRATIRTDLAAAIAEERYEDAGPLAARDRDVTAQILRDDATDRSVVDEAAIARVVAATAGIPVGSVAATEEVTLRNLGELLQGRVIGQEHAVAAVTSVVRRRRVLGAERPTSLMFVGPTGVGKTELAKALAETLFASGSTALGENTHRGALLRFDMSEFAEKHTVARLVGAPPGYVGHDQGGELTEAVRRNPYSVLLLDEVEKAHPDVFDLLLQVLEDGHLTDGAGKTVSFKDTIVVLTSNLGSAAAARGPIGFTTGTTQDVDAAARARTLEAVKGHFRPEFINRLDDIVVFDALTKHDLTAIVATMLDRPLAQLAEKGITVKLSDAAIDVLLEAGHEPAMGARPLRRAITRLLENPLSDAILAGQLPSGSTAFVDVASNSNDLVVLPEPAITVTAVDEAHLLA